MNLLLITACADGSPSLIQGHLLQFASVHTVYSPFYSLLPADFPFSLRLDTAGSIPWNSYDGIIVCGGSRICSLAAECARAAGIPAVVFYAPLEQVYLQAPQSTLIDLPPESCPALRCRISPLLKDLLSPSLFLETEHRFLSAPNRPIPEREDERFRSGACCDLVSVACSEDTSSASSSDGTPTDLRTLAEEIHQHGEASLQRISPLFAEFRWRGKRLMLYRQGRASLTPCEDAEEIFFAYQFFVNS